MRNAKLMKKLMAVTLAATMAVSMAGCGGDAKTDGAADAQTEDTAADAADAQSSSESSGEEITIKVFTNLPDRKSGQGMVEQMLFDQYMEENPNVNIEVEALDDASYSTKIKAYTSNSTMPDLLNMWGIPGMINQFVNAGVLEELNPDDYADYGFVEGSLDSFSKDGKLYGLPRNTDMMCFYYNEKMFQDHGWEIPETYDELLALGDTIKGEGIIPVAMDGGDKWPLYDMLTDLIQNVDGTGVRDKTAAAVANADFSDPTFKEAVETLVASSEHLFQDGFETADYGTAQNLFTNGQAAMYYMGSWDMTMATNEDIEPEIRENIRAFTMPAIEPDKVKPTDIAAWNGGGYSVSSKGAQKEEAVKLLNYMFRPENWTKLTWQNGVCMSAQDFRQFATGDETEVQKQLMEAVGNATSLSGTPIGDMGNSAFTRNMEDTVQEVAIGKITPDEFLKGLEEVAKTIED